MPAVNSSAVHTGLIRDDSLKVSIAFLCLDVDFIVSDFFSVIFLKNVVNL